MLKKKYLFKHMIKKSIGSILSNTFKLYKYLLWQYQYYTYVEPKEKQNIYNFKSVSRILVLVPHADDELIGCQQLIINKPKECMLFYYGFTGSSNDKGIKNVRKGEIRSICKHFNLRMTEASVHIEDDLLSLLNTYKPEIIAVPSIVDWHREHLQCNIILKDSLNRTNLDCRILQYQISIPIPGAYTTHIWPMDSKAQKYKWYLFSKYYISQKSLPVIRFKMLERLAGNRNNYYAAESYIISSIFDWGMKLDMISTGEIRKLCDELQLSINDIKKSKNKSQKIFKMLYEMVV